MSTDSPMTIVTALIRPHMEGQVVHALHDLSEFPGFFISEVRGQGRGRGAGGAYRATEFDFTYQRFLQVQVVCHADRAEAVCQAITQAAWTGHKGDGVVFTAAVGSFARIRESGAPLQGAKP